MKPAVLLRDPVQVLISTLAGEVLTDIALMNVGMRKPLLSLIKPLSSNNPGASSAEIALEGVDEVPTLISPSLTSFSPINDNYCVGPTPIQVTQVQLDLQSVQNKVFFKTHSVNNLVSKTVSNPVISKTVNLVVAKTLKLDHVANHAHTVPLHRLPQKKGLSPGQSLNRIKHVKGVCCVNPCLSAPLVPNVPNAVIRQSPS